MLTNAAATGQIDYLKGFKENVIMGHVIPAGTGFRRYSTVKMKKEAPELEAAVSEAGSE